MFPPDSVHGTAFQAVGNDRGQDARCTAADRLFRNRGDGRFEDVTERSGIGGMARDTATGSRWATTTTTAGPTCSSPAGAPMRSTTIGRWDVRGRDRGGGPGRGPRLADVGGVRRPRRRRRPRPLRLPLPRLGRPTSADLPRSPRPSAYIYCMPRTVDALPDHVFRNDGGRFVDVTAEAGIVDRDGPRPRRRRGRPRRRRPGRPLRRQRQDGQLPVPQPGRLPFRGGRAGGRRGRGGRRRVTRRAWAWPAATSTATAGSTWS